MAESKYTDRANLSPDEHRRITQEARERFKIAEEAESKWRARALADKRFADGEHWPEKARRMRELEGRPVLTIDRLTPQIKQVTNQQRAMRPAVQVSAVDSVSDPETAEVLQGLVRHIETQSNADDAYDTAGKSQAEIGRGYFRLLTEYCDEESDDQEIRIKRIRNPFSVYFDPACQELDYSDARFAFIVKDLERSEYALRYPNTEAAGLTEFQSLGDDVADWINEESVRIAEYWTVKVTREKRPASDGRKARTVERRKVCCYVLNGVEVLETYEWPAKWIPIIPVIGEESECDGEVDYRGMVRRAKDPQRMYNFWKTATTEAVALAPIAPFIVAEGQIDGEYRAMWKSANRKPMPYLVYKPVTIAGQPVAPPARNVTEAPVQAMMALTQGAENDLRAATGFYFDVENDGRREASGKAIQLRQQQGELGNSDFLDGLGRAIRFAGRQLVDLIPHIYDAPRVLRILGRDNAPKTVVVHAGNPEAAQQAVAAMQAELQKVAKIYDLSTGKYDVTVSVGPSHQTARQQFLEQMAQIFQGNPQLWQIVGDLFFENMDLPNARQIAERLKKMLPPQLQEGAGKDLPPAAQAQIQAMSQQIEQMGAALMEAQKAIEAKQLELASKEKIAAAEMEHKEKIEWLKAETEKYKADIDARMQELSLQLKATEAAAKVAVAAEGQAREHAHASRMAEDSAGREFERDAIAAERETAQRAAEAGA
jgi:hypothetical protein